MKFQIESSPVLDIAPEALSRMRDLANRSRDHETGGILVGFNEGRDIRITDVSGPGPNAEQSATHFLRDTQHCREFLQARYNETRADYVGEWHSHVVSLRRLSGGDLGTLAGLFIDPDYDFASFAVVLVVVREGEKPGLHVYLAERVGEAQQGSVKKRSGHSTQLVITELYSGGFPEDVP